MSWSADSVDCVVFVPPVPGAVPDALQPWLRVFTAPPRLYQGPVAGLGPGPVAQAGGTVGDYTATITAQLGRLELKLSAGVPPREGQIGFPIHQGSPPVIEDVLPALEALNSYAEQLVVGCNPARIGLVLNLSRMEKSAREAVASFQTSLPISEQLPESATDLSFALNLPLTVALSDSTSSVVNRLCRWSVARRQLMMFTIMGGVTAIPVLTMNESFASTLQVDINSTPEAVAGTIATWTPELAREVLIKMKTIALPIFENGYKGLLDS